MKKEDISEDLLAVEAILFKMNAKVDHIEQRGEFHIRVWVANEEGVKVCWVIFDRGVYSSHRYLRSSYGKPTPNAQVALDKAEKAVTKSLAEIDAFFTGSFYKMILGQKL